MKAIIFDLGGTIFIQKENVLDNVIKKVLINSYMVNTNEIDDICDFAVKIENEISNKRNLSNIEFTKYNLIHTIEKRYNLQPVKKPNEIELLFWDNQFEIQISDKLPALLAKLREHSVRMCILSNSSYSGDLLERQLDQFGIRHFFEFVLASSDIGIRKPYGAVFEIALNKLGLNSNEVWYVGDSLEEDIIGAKQNGIYSILVSAHLDEASDIKPDAHIRDISELYHLYLKYGS